MKSNNTAFKPTEPYYRPGQMIEEKSTAPKGVGTKDLQFEVKSPVNGHKCEKSVPMSKKKSPGKFIEESIEDLLDEDEKFPVKIPEPSKEVRAEQPSKDEEPEQASPVITKTKETKPVETLPMIKDQRRLSQEPISPIHNTKHPLAFVKSDKDLRGNASVLSEKSKGEFRQSTPTLAEQTKTLSGSYLSTSNNFGMYGKLIATSANGMTEAELVAENKLLRHFLRDLNDILNQQVGKIKVEEEHDNRKVEFKNKSPEEQMRTIVKEIANNEKIMAYNKEEHRKTEAKLDRIKDPGYLLNIQQEIETVQAKLDETKRDNKKLMHSNGNIGKDLDLIENVKGVPQALEETREKQIEIKKLTKKLEGLIQKNLTMEEEKDQKMDKKQTLVTEIKKLQREDESFNSEASINRASRLKYMLLMAEETYKSFSKRYRMKKINTERELEQMIVENHKGKEHIERLDDIIKEQNAMLKGMISSERGNYSKPAQEVLDKMRLSIEYDESKQKWGSSNYLDDDKLEALKVVPNRPIKSKSIERGGGRIKRDLFDLQDDRRVHQSYSKIKPAIKRELIGAKASIWKETVVGDRARMEEILNMSPSRKYQHEDPVYMKPIGNKKSYGFVVSAKNSEDEARGTPMFNGGVKPKPLGQSVSVKQLGTKGMSVPSPNESRMKPRGKEQKGINEESGLDNSWGDNSARKKQQSKGNILDNSGGGRESEVETAKPNIKTKKKTQLEQIVMDDIKKGRAKFKSVEDDDSIVKGNQGVKKPEQPDNSQKVQKKGNATKGSDVTKVKSSMVADFEELEFDD